ncbi:MAG: hypothetical protein KDC85_22830 [Saprospiraceae bacterium]|nr:hypothetical protein [Saprospiraceae bacterium]
MGYLVSTMLNCPFDYGQLPISKINGQFGGSETVPASVRYESRAGTPNDI